MGKGGKRGGGESFLAMLGTGLSPLRFSPPCIAKQPVIPNEAKRNEESRTNSKSFQLTINH